MIKEEKHKAPPFYKRFIRKRGRTILYILLVYGLIRLAMLSPVISQIDPMLFIQIALAMVMQVAQVVMYFGFFFYWLGGRTRVTTYLPGDLPYAWEDFVGNEAILERARLIVEMLTRQEAARALGGVRTTHMMFMGPPGTGKTYLAKIIASMAGVPVMIVEASSLLGTFIGIGPLKVIRLFKKINKLSRIWDGAIMFIDEIDTIGQARGGTGGGIFSFMGGNVGGQILNVMLACVSGISEPAGLEHRIREWLKAVLGIPYRWKAPNVIIIGATNKALETLDAALLRSGRLEEHLEFPLPNKHDLVQLVGYYLLKRGYEFGVVGVPHDETCDIEAMAWLASGSSQAGIEAAMNKAKRLAAAEGADKISLEHWMQAVVEARMGLKQPAPLTERDVKLLSYHEAGHGMAALIWGEGQKLPIATIDRYGTGALGHVMPIATEQHIMPTGGDLEAHFMVAISSLAAEEIVGQRTPGTVSDLDNVKRLTILLISQGIIGNPWMVKAPKETGGRTVGAALPISELSEEGHDLASAYFEARKAEAIAGMQDNRAALDAFAALLADKRTVRHDEIMEAVGDLLKPRKLEPFIWTGGKRNGK